MFARIKGKGKGNFFMKKFLVAFCLLFGIVGNSWGICELSESTDRTPSDEDLYPQNPNDNRMALICQKGKCEEDEIVYMDVLPHYIGNMFNSEGFTTVNDKAYYRCKIGGNDKWNIQTGGAIMGNDRWLVR